jgi:hypothetical protein
MAKHKTQEEGVEKDLLDSAKEAEQMAAELDQQLGEEHPRETDPTTSEGGPQQAEEDQDEPPSDGFEWETALPNSGGGSGQSSKYDWSAFPEPKDGRFPTKTYLGLKGPKPIYNSIKKFQAKLSEAGKAYPEFTCRVVKEGSGKDAKVVGVKVQRVK